VLLSFADGARLEAMTTASLRLAEPAPGAQQLGLTHLAISVGSEHRVDELTTRLRNDGIAVVDGPDAQATAITKRYNRSGREPNRNLQLVQMPNGR
jgi:hypothetical protein